jgi:anti-sigma factor RsiW
MRAVTCKDFVEFLDDYLGGGLSGPEREAFNAHLAVCPSCVAYMKTYRDTVRLGKAALAPSDEPLPKEVPEGLVRAIMSARSRKA